MLQHNIQLQSQNKWNYCLYRWRHVNSTTTIVTIILIMCPHGTSTTLHMRQPKRLYAATNVRLKTCIDTENELRLVPTLTTNFLPLSIRSQWTHPMQHLWEFCSLIRNARIRHTNEPIFINDARDVSKFGLQQEARIATLRSLPFCACYFCSDQLS